MEITVVIKCAGYGSWSYETVVLTRDDIEQLAIDKLRQSVAADNMTVTDVTYISKA